MRIRENVSIAELTTMRLGGKARYVLIAETPDDVQEAYDFAKEKHLPVWVMGGGANTIGRDEGYAGVILLNRMKGIFVRHGDELIEVDQASSEELGDEIILVGMGGEIWDDFVKFATDRGYTGIEAMSLIPGTLGAAPVQNIGAYGQDVAQVIEEVKAYDLKDNQMVTLKPEEMEMGYRHTRFNHGKDAGRFVIVSVAVRLKKGELKPPFYNSLQKYIDEYRETDFSPKNIRRIVSEIRNGKLPDPEQIASAGSFFKNVYLSKDEADKAEENGIPIWRNTDGTGKVNSGWLIEACGLKGQKLHGMRVSDKAALVLINEEAGGYSDLEAARAKIVDAVKEKFGFILEQEPVEISSNA